MHVRVRSALRRGAGWPNVRRGDGQCSRPAASSARAGRRLARNVRRGDETNVHGPARSALQQVADALDAALDRRSFGEVPEAQHELRRTGAVEAVAGACRTDRRARAGPPRRPRRPRRRRPAAVATAWKPAARPYTRTAGAWRARDGDEHRRAGRAYSPRIRVGGGRSGRTPAAGPGRAVRARASRGRRGPSSSATVATSAAGKESAQAKRRSQRLLTVRAGPPDPARGPGGRRRDRGRSGTLRRSRPR